MKKIIILGAGITGLAAGWFHKQKGNHVTIIEKGSRTGGWIRSTYENGFLFEQGPRGFRPSGKGKRTLDLVKELGIDNQLLAADKGARERYLILNQRLCRLSFSLLLRKGLLRAFFRDLCTPPSEKEDETIADFCRRRFNKTLTHTFVDPLVKGIFGGDLEKLSMKSCFPLMWDAEKKGAVFLNLKRDKDKPAASLYSFKEGMETLPKMLTEKMQGHILLNKTVVRLDQQGVTLSDGTYLEAHGIIAAIPAYALSELTGSEDPFTYASLTTINLGWNDSLLTKKGFGFLVPSQERERLLGITWDSNIFPGQNQGNQTRLCAMFPEKATLDQALEVTEKYLGIKKPPDAFLIHEAKEAIPQYLLGQQKRLETFRNHFPFKLIGNCYNGVGVNDCIEAAWKSAQSS